MKTISRQNRSHLVASKRGKWRKKDHSESKCKLHHNFKIKYATHSLTEVGKRLSLSPHLFNKKKMKGVGFISLFHAAPPEIPLTQTFGWRGILWSLFYPWSTVIMFLHTVITSYGTKARITKKLTPEYWEFLGWKR